MGTIGVAFGGPSPEHDISILTGLQVARLLADSGRDVLGLYWRKTGDWLAVPPTVEARDFIDPEPPGSRPVELVLGSEPGFVERKRLRSAVLDLDVVVNCCHGGPGENGTLAAALSAASIPCTGPGQTAAALAMDKHATNRMAAALGVPVAPHALLDPSVPVDFAGPYIVKPRFGGSSIGIETVGDVATALDLAASSPHLRDGAVIEQLLEGWVDVNMAVRSAPELSCSLIERPLRGDDAVYSYESKYLQGGSGLESAPRELPANLPDGVAAQIESATRTIARAFGLTGVSRIDFLWDQGERVIMNEVNSIPGALSLYLWKASGAAPLQVILDAIAEAQRSPVFRRWTSAGADGRALRSAGSIAAKLN